MGSNNFGIAISVPGVSVVNAKPSQLLLSSSNPFLKIDTQNPIGFQTFTLIINTDPPEPPSSGGSTYTTIYKFKHGYTYIPAVEMLCYVESPPPGTSAGAVMTYFMDWGQIGAHTYLDGVYFYAIADTTYVYLIIQKYNGGGGSTNLLTGTNLQVTVHTFVDDIGV